MQLFNKYNLNKIYILNIFIAALPITFILGNLATNINIFLICLLGIINFRKQIFFFEKKKYQYLIYAFFIYLIIITFTNNFGLISENQLYKVHIEKSLIFLRYLILFLTLTKLIESKNFNTKLFFIICAVCALVVGFDVVFQFFFKKNILGYPLYNNIRPSSFFKEELIAGSYLQKFSLFFIFYFMFFKKKYFNFLIILLFATFLFSIFLSLNRMPLIIFLMTFFLYFFIEKKFKEILISLFICLAIGITIFNLSPNNKKEKLIEISESFLEETSSIIFFATNPFDAERNSEYLNKSDYLRHFNTGIQIWQENKIFGNGLKSFRLKCTYKNFQTCNTHPHNYFIELLVDVGIVGLCLIYAIFIFGIIDFFKYYRNETNKKNKLISIVFFLLIFFEVFPLRSTGSFFTTNVSSFIFLILPIFLNVEKLKKL